MSGDYLELFWTLLEQGNLEYLKRSIPKDFSWNVLHPQIKTTILVTACAYNFPNTTADSGITQDLIEWLVKSGASYSQKCGASTRFQTVFKNSAPEEKDRLKVPYAGHSFLSYVKAWQSLFQGKDDWQVESANLTKIVEIIAKAACEHTRPRATIDEGIVEIWEKYLHTTESHDLTITARDGCVTCHAQLLMRASPVVQAMLDSPMKEGKSQTIRLQDTSSSAVQLFLDILYTCSSQSDPIEWTTAVSALDLAHCWQVEVVVAILADLLQSMIAEDSFSAIAEQAALKGLDQLMQQCRKFGTENATIRRQMKEGQLPRVVLGLFKADPPKAAAAKKRKRL